MSLSCYLRHSKLPIEEDLTHEFKAHRDLSDLDLSQSKYTLASDGGFMPKVQRFRATISKHLVGMLNTGLKSQMYLGVTDQGNAEGFLMSLYQKDHFQLSLRDLLSRFDPPCPDHLIDIRFVPVVDPDEDGIVAVEPIGLDVDRWLPHAVRDTRYCWCDCLSLAACTYGFIHRFYVIELHFNPWNKDDPRNAKLIRKDTIGDQRPIFANEHGKVYIRRNGYTTPVNEKDIGSLKKTCFQKGQGLPQGVQEEGTDYYSYEEL